MVPLAENQALGIAIMSYNGQLNFGLNADYDALRDLEVLADELRASIDELAAAAARPRRARSPTGPCPPRAEARPPHPRWAAIADDAARAPGDRARVARDRRSR